MTSLYKVIHKPMYMHVYSSYIDSPVVALLCLRFVTQHPSCSGSSVGKVETQWLLVQILSKAAQFFFHCLPWTYMYMYTVTVLYPWFVVQCIIICFSYIVYTCMCICYNCVLTSTHADDWSILDVVAPSSTRMIPLVMIAHLLNSPAPPPSTGTRTYTCMYMYSV